MFRSRRCVRGGAASRAALAGRALVARHRARRDVRRAPSRPRSLTSGRDDAQRILRLFVRLFRDFASVYHADWAEGSFPRGTVSRWTSTRRPASRSSRTRAWLARWDLRVARGAPGRHPRRARKATSIASSTAPSRRRRPAPSDSPCNTRTSSAVSPPQAALSLPCTTSCGTDPHLAAAQLGGTHHAFADEARASRVQRPGGRRDESVAVSPRTTGGHATPVLIIDLDVHQGNGTAKIFGRFPRRHLSRTALGTTRGRRSGPRTTSISRTTRTTTRITRTWLSGYRFSSTYDPGWCFPGGVDALRKILRATGDDARGALAQKSRRLRPVRRENVPLVITMGGVFRLWDASVAAHADVFRSAAYRFASPRAPEMTSGDAERARVFGSRRPTIDPRTKKHARRDVHACVLVLRIKKYHCRARRPSSPLSHPRYQYFVALVSRRRAKNNRRFLGLFGHRAAAATVATSGFAAVPTGSSRAAPIPSTNSASSRSVSLSHRASPTRVAVSRVAVSSGAEIARRGRSPPAGRRPPAPSSAPRHPPGTPPPRARAVREASARASPPAGYQPGARPDASRRASATPSPPVPGARPPRERRGVRPEGARDPREMASSSSRVSSARPPRALATARRTRARAALRPARARETARASSGFGSESPKGRSNGSFGVAGAARTRARRITRRLAKKDVRRAHGFLLEEVSSASARREKVS